MLYFLPGLTRHVAERFAGEASCDAAIISSIILQLDYFPEMENQELDYCYGPALLSSMNCLSSRIAKYLGRWN
jgi:hypothetical protein